MRGAIIEVFVAPHLQEEIAGPSPLRLHLDRDEVARPGGVRAPYCREPPGAVDQLVRACNCKTSAPASLPSMAAASIRPHNSIARACSGQRLAR